MQRRAATLVDALQEAQRPEADRAVRKRMAEVLDDVERDRNMEPGQDPRSEEHTSELQSSQISYAVFCLKKKKQTIRSVRCDAPSLDTVASMKALVSCLCAVSI